MEKKSHSKNVLERNKYFEKQNDRVSLLYDLGYFNMIWLILIAYNLLFFYHWYDRIFQWYQLCIYIYIYIYILINQINLNFFENDQKYNLFD